MAVDSTRKPTQPTQWAKLQAKEVALDAATMHTNNNLSLHEGPSLPFLNAFRDGSVAKCMEILTHPKFKGLNQKDVNGRVLRRCYGDHPKSERVDHSLVSEGTGVGINVASW